MLGPFVLSALDKRCETSVGHNPDHHLNEPQPLCFCLGKGKKKMRDLRGKHIQIFIDPLIGDARVHSIKLFPEYRSEKGSKKPMTKFNKFANV